MTGPLPDLIDREPGNAGHRRAVLLAGRLCNSHPLIAAKQFAARRELPTTLPCTCLTFGARSFDRIDASARQGIWDGGREAANADRAAIGTAPVDPTLGRVHCLTGIAASPGRTRLGAFRTILPVILPPTLATGGTLVAANYGSGRSTGEQAPVDVVYVLNPIGFDAGTTLVRWLQVDPRAGFATQFVGV